MSGEFKIEKNISVPKNNNVGRRRYPFNEMEIGNSILVSASTAVSARNAAFSYARRNKPVKFTSMILSDGAIRIWRIA